jgi:hypothetical protein
MADGKGYSARHLEHRDYYAEGEITGGPAQVIADARVAFGGAWNAQDVIVYPPWPSGGLYQVTTAGGAPKPATVLDNARGEFAHCHPIFARFTSSHFRRFWRGMFDAFFILRHANGPWAS